MYIFALQSPYLKVEQRKNFTLMMGEKNKENESTPLMKNIAAMLPHMAALLPLPPTSKEASGQKQAYAPACIAFYNIENLFDAIDSPGTGDAESLPHGANRWTSERYARKQRWRGAGGEV